MDMFGGDANEAWSVMHRWHKHAIKHGLAKDTMESFTSSDEMAAHICDLTAKKDAAALSSFLTSASLNVEQITRIILETSLVHGGKGEGKVKSLLEGYGVAKGSNKQQSNPDTHEILGVLLSCVKEGVESRGLGEEKYLSALFNRYRERKNPAQKANDVANAGGMEALIKHAAIKI